MWLKGAEALAEEKTQEIIKGITPEEEDRIFEIIDQSLQQFINRTKLLVGMAVDLIPRTPELDDLLEIEEALFRELSMNHEEYREALLSILKAKYVAPEFVKKESADPKERWLSILKVVNELADDEIQEVYEAFHGPTDVEVDADYLKYYLSNVVGDIFRVERKVDKIVQTRKIKELLEQIKEPKDRELEPHYQTIERITSPLSSVKLQYQRGRQEFQDRIYTKISDEVLPALQTLFSDQVEFLKSIFDKRKNVMLFPKKKPA